MDFIETSISVSLPTLPASAVEAVVSKLTEAGVETQDDLQHVTEEDLRSVLKPIQLRKLLLAWKPPAPLCGSSSSHDSLSLSSSTSSPPASPSSRPASPHSPLPWSSSRSSSPSSSPRHLPHTLNPNWSKEFDLPWNKMPHSLVQSFSTGARPHPSDRKAMVRILVDEMKQLCPKPSWKASETVAQRVTETHPDSLEDRLEQEKIGSGYSSLAKQIQNRWENVNRGMGLGTAQLRQKRKLSESNSTNVSVTKRLDKYGCINWQPEVLPTGETDNTLSDKRMQLINLFRQGEKAWVSSEADLLMETTYYSQRLAINGGNSIPELIQEWPLLFIENGLLKHFRLLVDIDLKKDLLSALEQKAPRILGYMSTLTKKEIRAVLDNIATAKGVTGDCSADLPGVIMAVMAFFGEKPENIFILADKTVGSADVEKMAHLPDTPCLVVCGDSLLTSNQFMLCIDQHVVNDHLKTFTASITLLFAVFYCFNIQYPQAAASTLEFIQRCLVKINPEKGSKARKTGKRTTINPKVLTLLNGIADYEWTM